jgi:hypothetical protein
MNTVTYRYKTIIRTLVRISGFYGNGGAALAAYFL